jgi:polyadenylate-binding protein
MSRIEDDAALRAKVDEALVVYDEYVRNKASAENEPTNDGGTKGEGIKKEAEGGPPAPMTGGPTTAS